VQNRNLAIEQLLNETPGRVMRPLPPQGAVVRSTSAAYDDLMRSINADRQARARARIPQTENSRIAELERLVARLATQAGNRAAFARAGVTPMVARAVATIGQGFAPMGMITGPGMLPGVDIPFNIQPPGPMAPRPNSSGGIMAEMQRAMLGIGGGAGLLGPLQSISALRALPPELSRLHQAIASMGVAPATGIMGPLTAAAIAAMQPQMPNLIQQSETEFQQISLRRFEIEGEGGLADRPPARGYDVRDNHTHELLDRLIGTVRDNGGLD
jgi:hypothetical protein